MKLKYKNLVKNVIVHSGILRFLSRITNSSIAILRYHSIQENPLNFTNSIGLAIIHTKSLFEEQMEFVAQYFKPVTMDDILLFLKGEKNIPRKAVAVTFDDGFADNSEIAVPILNHFGIPASFFITMNSIESENPPWFCRLRHAFFTTQNKEWFDSEKSNVWNLQDQMEQNAAFLSACGQCARLVENSQDGAVSKIESDLEVEPFLPKNGIMMSWDQIRKLHKDGHIIGSHTLTHPNLAHIDDEDLHRELVESKQILEDKLDTSIIHFSYPSPILQPHWSEKTIAATKQAGYQTAVTCTPGPVRRGTNALSLNRIWVPHEKNDFLWNLECTLLGRKM